MPTALACAHWAALAAVIVVGCGGSSPGTDRDAGASASTGPEGDSDAGHGVSTDADVDASGGTAGDETETVGDGTRIGESGASSGDANDAGTGGPPLSSDVVIYLNFDGVTLTEGPDDSILNQTTVGLLVGDHKPFDGDPQPYVDGVREFWSHFGVTVTDERPQSGDYTMVVVAAPGPALDSTSVDCANANARSVAAVFETDSMGPGFPFFLIGKINYQIGWTLGLETVSDEEDLMNYGSGSTFLDECVPLQNEAHCPRVHALHCPPGQQNSYAEVVAAVSN